MPRRLADDELERFLGGRHVAVLATVGDNGNPVLTPIWYLYRDGVFLMRTGEKSIKARNIGRDSRVSMCIQDERAPYRSVTVYGRASIQEPVSGLGVDISRHYLGAVGGYFYLRAAREAVEQSSEVTIVLTPERTVSQDFSTETPWVGRAWLLVKRLLPPWL